MVSAGDEGTACYVCRNCMKATDIAYQSSKKHSKYCPLNNGTGDTCPCPDNHTTSKSEEDCRKDWEKYYRVIDEVSELPKDFWDKQKVDAFNSITLPRTRLENWKQEFYKRFTDRSSQPHKPLTCNITVLPFEIESFISTLLQEEREKQKQNIVDAIDSFEREFHNEGDERYGTIKHENTVLQYMVDFLRGALFK